MVSAAVLSSEERTKVLSALRNVLGDSKAVLHEAVGTVSLESGDPEALKFVKNQLRDRRVRSAARRLLLESLDGRFLDLLLNKQAAYAGVIALCSTEDQSPLGPIFLRVESPAPERLVDWLTFPQRPEYGTSKVSPS